MRISRLIIGLRSIDLEHEAEEGDTIGTITAYLKENRDQYKEYHQVTEDIVGSDADVPEKLDVTDGVGATSSEPEPTAEKPKRGRKPKAAVEVVAPAPIPVGSEPPAPIAPAPDTGIPPFLNAAVVAAPPPPVTPAPVAPPPAPPVAGPLAQKCIKIIETIRAKVAGAQDGGAGYLKWFEHPQLGLTEGNTVDERLSNWVASSGVSVPGAPADEVLLMLQMTADDRLVKIASVANEMARALSIA